MKPLEWNEEKNEWLKRKRDISFEEIEEAIGSGGLIARIAHPNRSTFPHQKFFIVYLQSRVCVVPFVEDETKIFFKTAYFSRKYYQLFKNQLPKH